MMQALVDVFDPVNKRGQFDGQFLIASNATLKL